MVKAQSEPNRKGEKEEGKITKWAQIEKEKRGKSLEGPYTKKRRKIYNFVQHISATIYKQYNYYQ